MLQELADVRVGEAEHVSDPVDIDGRLVVTEHGSQHRVHVLGQGSLDYALSAHFLGGGQRIGCGADPNHPLGLALHHGKHAAVVDVAAISDRVRGLLLEPYRLARLARPIGPDVALGDQCTQSRLCDLNHRARLLKRPGGASAADANHSGERQGLARGFHLHNVLLHSRGRRLRSLRSPTAPSEGLDHAAAYGAAFQSRLAVVDIQNGRLVVDRGVVRPERRTREVAGKLQGHRIIRRGLVAHGR
mmetsp:Transcript_76152/g.233018  ORF Transcript_76152/g.233018 Transcript_76152/m.233018 type:complete len:245 (-) Transcript_76152:849-1583(-)